MNPPSERLIRPSRSTKRPTTKVAATRMGMSQRMTLIGTAAGRMVKAVPTTRPRLKTFEPRTLPTPISVWPLRAATTEVASSGREVPNATTVSPTSASETPNRRARSTPPMTNISEPPIRIAIPTAVSAKWRGSVPATTAGSVLCPRAFRVTVTMKITKIASRSRAVGWLMNPERAKTMSTTAGTRPNDRSR